MGSEIKKIIAVRRGALGDTILFFPVLMAMGRAYPGARIFYIGNGDYAWLAKELSLAHEVRSVETWRPMLELLSKGIEKGVFPVEFQGPTKVYMEWERTFDLDNVRFFSPLPDSSGEKHISRVLLERTGFSGLLDFPLDPLAGTTGKKARGKFRIFIHPGAGSCKKAWGMERFMELGTGLSRQGFHVSFVLGPAEMEKGVGDFFLREKEKNGWNVYSFRELRPFYELLKEGDLLVGNDSGPVHLGGVMGIPTIAIFGPTNPRVWAPPWKNVRVISRPGGLEVLETREVMEACLQELQAAT